MGIEDDRTAEFGPFDDTTTQASVSVRRPVLIRRHHVLRQLSGPGAPCSHVIAKQRTVVGRSSAADITIPSPELSRQHVVFELRGEELRCIDLDSRNGLYLNGLRIHSCTLRRGDTLQLGNVTFLYDEGEL